MPQYELIETIYYDGTPFVAGSVVDASQIPGEACESWVHRGWARHHEPSPAPASDLVPPVEHDEPQPESVAEPSVAPAAAADPAPAAEPAPPIVLPVVEPPKPPRKSRK